MANLLKVAVIGLGNMGRHHVRHYAKSPVAKLVAVCDATPDRLTAYQDQYETYTSVDDLVANHDLDALSIAVPTQYHAPVAIACLQAGVAVLIEKPIALTIAESKAIIAAGDANQQPVMIGHIERFNPALMALKSYCDTGIMGDIIAIQSTRFSPLPSQIKDMTVLEDLGVHDVDIMAYLLDRPVSSKTILPYYTNSVMTHASLSLDYSGIACSCQVSWVHPMRQRQLSITATQGYAVLDYTERRVRIYKSDNPDGYQLPVIDHDPLGQEIAHFLGCVSHKTTPVVDGHAGLDALTTIQL